jgi:hypothetical protein
MVGMRRLSASPTRTPHLCRSGGRALYVGRTSAAVGPRLALAGRPPGGPLPEGHKAFETDLPHLDGKE